MLWTPLGFFVTEMHVFLAENIFCNFIKQFQLFGFFSFYVLMYKVVAECHSRSDPSDSPSDGSISSHSYVFLSDHLGANMIKSKLSFDDRSAEHRCGGRSSCQTSPFMTLTEACWELLDVDTM